MSEDESNVQFQRRFLLVFISVLSLGFLWMVRDYLAALLLAAIAAGLVHPLHRRVTRWLRGRETLAAVLVVLVLLVVILGPVTAFVGLVISQAADVTASVRPWVEAQLEPGVFESFLRDLPLVDRLPWLASALPDRAELAARGASAVSSVGSFLVRSLGAATRGTAGFLLDLFIFLYAMFFFVLHGKEALARTLSYVPLSGGDKAELLSRFLSVTRATLKGSFVIGFLQGALAGLAFWLAGIQGAAFWATVMMVLSLVPGVGAPLIWIPAVVYLLLAGSVLSGLLLAAWCGVVVGSIDNVLRPRLVGSDARMNELLILLSTLGGLSLFGAVGVLLGPILAAVWVTGWEIYGKAFRNVLDSLQEG